MLRHRRLLGLAVLVFAWISTSTSGGPLSPNLRPVATAVADFDGDGADDVAVLYAGAKEAQLLLLTADREAGTLRAERKVEALGIRADFLAGGDFDGDAIADVVLGERGAASLTTLLGDGRGGFGRRSVTMLSGGLTALIAADVNRADGLLDWVAGVVDDRGSALLVFEGLDGALSASPERIALPAPAEALAAGRFQGSYLVDVAAACGSELATVAGRDRRLHTPGAATTEPVVTAVTLPAEAVALTTLRGTQDLAVRDVEGMVRVLRDGTVLEENPATDPADTVRARLRLDGDGLDDVVIADGTDGAVRVVPTATATAFVVNSTADTGDASIGDAVCDDGTGACTLRAALQEANAAAGADTITFSLGTGTPTITPASPLPLVSSPVTIQGNTGGATRIQLNGASAGFSANGFHFSAGSEGSLVRSFVINRFVGWGLRLDSGSNTVEDCWIGLDATGGSTVTANQTGGILLFGAAASGNLIGGSAAGTRNVIAKNLGPGIRLESGALNNRIRGNYIGTNPGANVAVANGLDGVELLGAAAGNRIDGNVISGNTGNGISISGMTSTGTLIEGNFIGLHGSGLSALGNGANGILITNFASSNTVGGTTAAQRNVISGNNFAGADGIELSTVDSTHVFGNYIGLDVNGANPLSNGQDGIKLTGTATGTSVGAATATPGTAGGNVIAGNNRHGLRIENASSGTMVQGNVIGLRANGTTAQANASSGISVAATNTTIGGPTATQRNVVSGGNSISVLAGAHNTAVQGNFLGTDVSGTVKVVDGGVGAGDLSATGINGFVVGGSTSSPGTPPGNVIAGGVGLNGQGVQGALVQGNIVGLDKTGTVVLGGTGVVVGQGSKNNTIGGTTAAVRNVLSGNTRGVTLQDLGTTGNQVQGNYIGTDLTGTVALGNQIGVYLTNASTNTVGGSTATPGTGAGNVISGNTTWGVGFEGGGTGNLVRGNIVGAMPSGLASLPNRSAGIFLGQSVAGMVIGGPAAGDRNLISGNSFNATDKGVDCQDCMSNNLLQGNWIGVDLTGAAALGNGIGVALDGPASGSRGSLLIIGGPNAGEGNVISGNQGVGILASDNDGVGSVFGNLIGVAPNGTGAMGNGSHGISTTGFSGPIVGSAEGVTTGACTGACNQIRFNNGNGVHFPYSQSREQVIANRISDNALLGIDFAGTGPTPNDPGDGSLPQNSPVITVVIRSGNTSIQGTVQSAASTLVSIDVYGSATADPSGYGEGDVYLGRTYASTDTAGNGSWTITIPSAPASITAIATLSSRGSSEFALNFLDADGDGFADGFDVCPGIPNPDQIDGDFDGHGDPCDCAPGNNTVFAAPTEVAGLTMSADKAHVSWVSQIPTTGPSTVHQVLRGALAELPVGSGAQEICFNPSEPDIVTDQTVPLPGEGLWYLVRAKNACAVGTYGNATAGPRSSVFCP